VLPATPHPVSPIEALTEMRTASDLLPIGRIATASNASFLCELVGAQIPLQVIYKPIRGEAPLWDFPTGTLAGREVAAYMLSEALGLAVVPPTLLRDGPADLGCAQLWIEHEGVQRAIDLVNATDESLRPIALFDAIVNNGDRKAGHLLPLADGRVLGVDHGVTFAVEPKLRTVLWGWRSEAFTAHERAVLERGAALLGDQPSDGGALLAALGEQISVDEIAATRARIDALRAAGGFPEPSEDWPPLPWPLV
jgi:uncharacterized repeat protein (TIGR03843 family)